MYQYLFFRVARFQVARSRDPYITATAILTFPIATIVLLVDAFIGKIVTGVSAYELIGRWPLGVAVFAVIELLHYLAFVRGGRASKIMNKFSDHDPYGRLWGNTILISYFAAPIVLFAIAFSWFRT